tara:strand:+ start:21 stop:236 length:216 start_codon:yes stop_codon:yes gene_type:complete
MSDTDLLVGYVRKAGNGDIKISVNESAFGNCNRYTTSDGQVYVPLKISRNALDKIIRGERAVTTVTQKVEE